jgi:hypothetical protein
MVNNFTANQIGDSFIARLAEPYTGVIRVLDYEIVIGVTSPNTVGTLTFYDASTTVHYSGAEFKLIAGQSFIVGNLTYTVDQVIDANTFTITEPAPFTLEGLKFYELPDANNQMVYEFRWSQAPKLSEGGEMSEFRDLNKDTGARDLLGLTFDDTKPLWLDLKATVDKLSQARSITLLSVTYQLETEAGTIVSCPQFCDECADPYAMDGCANIVSCDLPLYDPYKLKKPSSIYRQISDLSTEMWGHPVKYFRVEPDQRSKDVILMEYSLYNVVEQGELKIMVPDNALPTQQFSYDIFGIGFEDFEVHITKSQFEKAFGIGPRPRSRDYLYFPLINRMYEVNAVSYADEFNLDLTYWKVMLKKFEERTSSIITDTAIEQELDDLTVGIEEIFGEEIQEEYTKVTKPTQYQTTYSEVGDGTRARMHTRLGIIDGEIRNRWTIVAKNYYDLDSTGNEGIEILAYNKKAELSIKENIGFTVWFRPKFVDDSQQILVDSSEANQGFRITVGPNSTKIKLNNDLHTFDHPAALTNGVWYGLVFNMNNTFQEISTHIYKLDPNSNWIASNDNSKSLTLFMSGIKPFTNPYGWTLNKNWNLMPSKMDVTNLRLFKKTIGQDQHTNILQQYIVRDSQLAHIIDNAVPSIQLRRYRQNR